MMKDKALEELFKAQRPVFEDKDKFMAQIEKKLDAVEFLRKYEEANLRRYKYVMVATFVMGIVVGGFMLAYILSVPADVPLVAINATSDFMLYFEQNSRMLASWALMLFLSFGIVSIISNMLDILKHRDFSV
mgnify:CR=1 FL=1